MRLKKVFSRADELESMGLRVPQVTKIIFKLREMGYSLPLGVLTVEQAANELQALLDKQLKIRR